MTTRRLLAAAAILASAASCSREEPTPPVEVPAASPLVHDGDSAIALYERRTAADPRDHLSATTLAVLHLARADRNGDPQEYVRAEKAARVALERQPDHGAAVAALGRALIGQGDVDRARTLLEDFLSGSPRHTAVLAASFEAALAAGDERAAAAYADRMLAIDESPETLSCNARLAERRGQTDRAIELYRRAAKDAADLGGMPAEIAAYRRRAGWAALAAERADDATREFDAALATDPQEALAWQGRAEVLARAGRTKEAVDAMAKAAALRPVAETRARLEAMRTAAAAGSR